MPSGTPKKSHPRSAREHGEKECPEIKAKFIALLRQGNLPGLAAEKLGLGRATVFKWKDKDKDFKAQWNLALDDSYDKLEAEARRRAEQGVKRGVYHAGVIVGHEVEFSDTLMSLLLKGRRRDVFNTERHEHTGADGEPIAIVQRTIVRAPERGDKKDKK